MLEERNIQLESWNICVKNANAAYKLAESNYRSKRLKDELMNEGLITNRKNIYKDYIKAKNKIKLAISHLHWAQDGLNDFIEQHPHFRL
jgi:hypothetical protein